MNYGSACRKWHSDDEWPWCFVGFDTICPDRHGARKSRYSTELPKDVLNMTWQWRSQLPCEQDTQKEYVGHAASLCENVNVAMCIGLFLFFLFSLPMYVATFQFIGNRCNDFTETEEQFDVAWSDSSSSSSSEGDAEK